MIGLYAPAPAFVASAHPPKGRLKPLSPAAREILKKAVQTRKPEDILAAKRALAAEGRYSCCITGGGCLECLLEGACACGPQLNEKEGVCKECVAGWQAGMGKFEGILASEVRLEAMSRGSLGDWPMMREGSGTSWIPDDSPMFARVDVLGGTTRMLMGQLYSVQTRGTSYTTGQGMAMAWGDVGAFRVGGKLMLSADPLLMGRGGYPLLLQTGEGLTDRQHPHDFVKEAAVTAAHRGAFVYLAPIGEPALGPAAYVHRPSALDNPEAPLTHHYFDSTHITHGVVTAGYSMAKLRLEGSWFNGHEPDNNRWSPDPIHLNSGSVRLAYNPDTSRSFQLSYGSLAGRGDGEHGEHGAGHGGSQARTMLSYARSSGEWQSLIAAGQRRQESRTRYALLAESARIAEWGTLFSRAEWVQNDELPGNSAGKPIAKLTIGAVKNLSPTLGVGGSFSVHQVPGALRPVYGTSPWSANLFLRLRAPRM